MNQDNPILEILPDGEFCLHEDLMYRLGYDNDTKTFRYIIIPKGYRTNFATMPGIARLFISPIDPEIVHGALVHDFLVGEWGTVPGYPKAITIDNGTGKQNLKYDPVDWKQAVATLRKIMTEDKAPGWKSNSVYLFVRLYGFIARKK